jgi:hypothetical protein
VTAAAACNGTLPDCLGCQRETRAPDVNAVSRSINCRAVFKLRVVLTVACLVLPAGKASTGLLVIELNILMHFETYVYLNNMTFSRS